MAENTIGHGNIGDMELMPLSGWGCGEEAFRIPLEDEVTTDERMESALRAPAGGGTASVYTKDGCRDKTDTAPKSLPRLGCCEATGSVVNSPQCGEKLTRTEPAGEKVARSVANVTDEVVSSAPEYPVTAHLFPEENKKAKGSHRAHKKLPQSPTVTAPSRRELNAPAGGEPPHPSDFGKSLVCHGRLSIKCNTKHSIKRG